MFRRPRRRFENGDLYRVTLSQSHDLRARFQHWSEARETLTGAPLRPLGSSEQAGRAWGSSPRVPARHSRGSAFLEFEHADPEVQDSALGLA